MQIIFNDSTGTDDYNINLSKLQFEDLLQFLNNPDAYEMTKKYNLY